MDGVRKVFIAMERKKLSAYCHAMINAQAGIAEA